LYRFQKVIRRNKLAFGAGAAVFAALVIGLGLSTWLFLKERGTRQRAVKAEQDEWRQRLQAEAEGEKARSEAAKSQQVARFLEDMLQSVGPSVALGRDTALLEEILEKTEERLSRDLTEQPEVEAELRTTIGLVYTEFGQSDKAEGSFRKALALRRRLPGADLAVATSLRNLGSVLRGTGKSEARATLEEALAINRKLLGNEDIEVVNCLKELIYVIDEDGTRADTENLVRQVLAMQKKILGSENIDVSESLEWLAWLQADEGDLATAEGTQLEVLAMQKRLSIRDSHVPWTLYNLATILLHRGTLVEAEAASREAVAKWDSLMGNNELYAPLLILDGLTEVLRAEGKLAEASDLTQKGIAKSEQALSEKLASQPARPDLLRFRASLRGRMGRWREAAADLSKVVELRPDNHQPLPNLAAALVEVGDLESYRRLCAQIRQRFYDTDSPEIASVLAAACLLVPSPEPADVVADSRMADMGLRLYQGDRGLASRQRCKALAEYRQGSFASAAEWASKALSQPEYISDRLASENAHCIRVEASMVRAMSNYQLHHPDEARAILASGLEFANKKLPNLESGDLGSYWGEWICAQVLMREARALIEGGSKRGDEK
jgi:tetratricopeptide (TPR) repeat protein